MIIRSEFFIFIISILFGTIFTLLFLGISHISPLNTEWFNSYDLKSDLIAFKFFYNDNWRFPIGLNPNYGEIPNSIVFSGAVPILSIVSKFFKFILPDNFHFFSFWIFICFSFQFLFGYKIIHHLTKNNYYSFVSAIFFLISPILIYRLNLHLSLSAHWLILASIYLDINQNQKNLLSKKIFLIVISSLIHFYFTIMLIIMNVIFSFFNNKLKFSYNFFRENFLILLFLLITMFLIGYFHIPATDALGFGFGYYKTNLLSFFDPAYSDDLNSWSIFLPNIYNSGGEKEGFAYLGLGMIIMIFYLMIKKIKDIKSFKFNNKYLILCLILFILALSNNISLGSFDLITFNLPNFLYAPLSVIRASGRLIWPVYYLIIIFTIFKFYKLKKNNYLILLVFFLSVQVIDFSKSLNNNLIKEKEIFHSKLNDKIWFQIAENFKKISTTKISNRSVSFNTVSNFLIKNDFESTNYFRLGRYNREAASIYRAKFVEDLNNRIIDLDKAYVIENFDQLRHLKILFENSNHGFFYRDGLWFLLPNQKSLMTQSDIDKFNSIDFHIITKNEFYINQNDKEGILGLGWSHPNYGRNLRNSGVWSEGYYSSFIFKAKKDDINSLSIFLSQVFANKNKNLNLEIFINENKYENISLDSTTTKIFLININDYIIDGINTITINIINPSTPLSKLTSIDGRLLGIMVEKILFE